MSDVPTAMRGTSEYAYEDRGLLVCPECAHEWSLHVVEEDAAEGKTVKDANGHVRMVIQPP